eukprot:4768518-Prymnesium_polylepis.2
MARKDARSLGEGAGPTGAQRLREAAPAIWSARVHRSGGGLGPAGPVAVLDNVLQSSEHEKQQWLRDNPPVMIRVEM